MDSAILPYIDTLAEEIILAYENKHLDHILRVFKSLDQLLAIAVVARVFNLLHDNQRDHFTSVIIGLATRD